MAVSFPLNLPSTVSRLSLRLQRMVAESPPSFTFQRTYYDWGGAAWGGEATVPPVEGVLAAAWRGFFTGLGGKRGTFLLGDPAAAIPRGTAAASPASTNLLPNGDGAGAVEGEIGSGGAMPDDWHAPGAGLTTEIVAAGAGFVDIRVHGTPSASAAFVVTPSIGDLAVSAETTYTASLSVALVGGDLSNISGVTLRLGDYASGAGNGQTDTAFTPGAMQRVVTTRETAAGTTHVTTAIRLGLTSGQPVDLTLRFAGWQIEAGDAATAYIPTQTGPESREGPTVRGGGQTGSTLLTTGWQPNAAGVLLSGDYIQLGTGADSRLYMVVADADADAAGEAALAIAPDLRQSPPDGAAVITHAPKGVFRLTINDPGWDVEPGPFYSFSFAFREAL